MKKLVFLLVALLLSISPAVYAQMQWMAGGKNPLATDDFNRTDANPIGTNWTTAYSHQNVQIVSNQAQPAGTHSAWAGVYWSGGNFSPNQCSKVKTIAQDGLQVRVRTQSGVHSTYSLLIWAANWYIYKFTNGTGAVIAGPFTRTWVSGDVFELCVHGTTLDAYINGVLTQTATDSALSTGQPGFALKDSGTYSQAIVDNWEGRNY